MNKRPFAIVREISNNFADNKMISDAIIYDSDQLKLLIKFNKNKKIKMKIWYLNKK